MCHRFHETGFKIPISKFSQNKIPLRWPTTFLLSFFLNQHNKHSSLMAGAGRRSQYRKHLTDAVLNDLPEPSENEWIARVIATRGGNQFDIETPAVKSTLAILPQKFHKVVWVKRNDFVIVEGGGGNEDDEKSGIRFIINHILYKEQIKHLRSKNLWPKEFDCVDEEDHELDEDGSDDGEDEKEEETGDGIVYDQGYDLDDELVLNTNRALKIEDPESESDED